MISRDEAAEIARREAIAHRLGGEVSKVFHPNEITFRAPFVLDGMPENCWVAYIEKSRPPMLRSSTIVIVDCERGTVLYRGIAGDEG